MGLRFGIWQQKNPPKNQQKMHCKFCFGYSLPIGAHLVEFPRKSLPQPGIDPKWLTFCHISCMDPEDFFVRPVISFNADR